MKNPPCELCTSDSDLATFEVIHHSAVLCSTCRGQIENPKTIDANHWHCLNESIWSENPGVKILAWRILKKLPSESWAQDLLDQLYMEDDLLALAQAEGAQESEAPASSGARDSNDTALNDGDSVSLIKDLEVKGAGFTAKRGTIVKKISLTNDPGLVEGKVNGTQIVLKTCFLKKAT